MPFLTFKKLGSHSASWAVRRQAHAHQRQSMMRNQSHPPWSGTRSFSSATMELMVSTWVATCAVLEIPVAPAERQRRVVCVRHSHPMPTHLVTSSSREILQGHPQAMFDLGTLYYDGHGVPRSYARAIEWLEKAARVRITVSTVLSRTVAELWTMVSNIMKVCAVCDALPHAVPGTTCSTPFTTTKNSNRLF